MGRYRKLKSEIWISSQNILNWREQNRIVFLAHRIEKQFMGPVEEFSQISLSNRASTTTFRVNAGHPACKKDLHN